MQNKAKKTAKKKKQALVYKPFRRGTVLNGATVRRSLRLSVYFLLFLFFYFILGTIFQISTFVLRVAFNLFLIAIGGMLVYLDGVKQGDAEVALGETALAREAQGRELTATELARCYHPGKPFLTALLACLPILVLAGWFALTAEKQVFSPQALPAWVSSLRKGDADFAEGLSYYAVAYTLTAKDVIMVLVRALNMPFVSIASPLGADAMLLVDRLSPLLICLPMLGYPLGYLTGPRSRAKVHGDISTNRKRHIKKQKREIKARRERNRPPTQIV